MPMARFVIIGGGIAGLTAANALASAGSVTLFERSRRPGGRARTSCSDGYSLNLGPHALIADGVAARTFRQWDIQLFGGDPAERGKGKCAVIVRGTELYPVVNNFASLTTSRMFSPRDKIELAGLLGFMTHQDAHISESANEWLNRRVRSERVRQYLRMGIRTATYSLDFDQLSAKDALRQLALTIKPGVLYLNGGWQTLMDGLVRRATSLGVRIQTETSIESLAELQADGIVVATDRRNAQQLTGFELPPSIPAYIACLDLCLKNLPQGAPTVAFAVDRPLYYSVHSVVAALAPPGHALVHVMKYLPGGTGDPQSVRRELEEYAELVMPGWRQALESDRFLPRRAHGA
jgi:phytoene dehydrogenase-like protein